MGVDSTGRTAHVQPGAVSADLLDVAVDRCADVVIFPMRRTAAGLGVCPHDTVFMAKELRAAGVSAVYLDDTSTRVFEVKKSAAVDIVRTFVVGVASTAAWDAIKFLVGKVKDDGRKMEITYADLTPDGGRRQWTVKGEGHEVIEAIDRLSSDAGAMTFPTAGSNEDLREAATRAQIDGLRLEGDRLLAGARALMSKNAARQGRRRAEATTRKALACYASALNWAEDTPVFDDTHTRLERQGCGQGGPSVASSAFRESPTRRSAQWP